MKVGSLSPSPLWGEGWGEGWLLEVSYPSSLTSKLNPHVALRHAAARQDEPFGLVFPVSYTHLTLPTILLV